MNDKRLCIYLDDHLALMVAEIELIGRCSRSNQQGPLGDFLQQLDEEVTAQKAIVSDVFHRIGGESSVQSRVKQGAAWFAEKLGRLKLNDSLLTYSALSRVVELEALSAAAHERVALWDNLESAAGRDPRLAGLAFASLRDQSRQHLDRLNAQRKAAAVLAFADDGAEGA